MRTRMTIGGALLLLMIAMTAGCEDSDVTAPPGSVITLIPSPASIFIDQEASQSQGTAALVAQVVDAGGLPLASIPLFFTTDGGQLASLDNICIVNTCSRTGADCTLDPCVQLPGAPTAIFTNSSGVATDTLLLRLIDPDSVVTTVQGTGLTAMATVTKTVNVGTNPVANIVMSPPVGQLSGEIFLANGTGSAFDPQFDPTCYEWTINSTIEPTDVRRSPNLSILDDLQVGQSGNPADDQTLTISLRVSDEPAALASCVDGPVGPADALFSDFPDSVSYLIRCDLTSPEDVDAGPDRFESLSNFPDSKVSVALSAVGSDPEFPVLSFNWNCGGGVCSTGPSFCADDPNVPCTSTLDCINAVPSLVGPCTSPSCDGQAVTCTYDVAGGFSPKVTVTNDCLLTTIDSLIVTIVQ